MWERRVRLLAGARAMTRADREVATHMTETIAVRRWGVIELVRRAWRTMYPSRAISIALDVPPARAIAALEARVRRPGLRAIFHSGMVGRVTPQRIRLRRRYAWRRNRYGPVFVGRIEREGHRARLVGTIAAPRATRIAMGIILGVFILGYLANLVFEIHVRDGPIDVLFMTIVPPVFLVLLFQLARWAAQWTAPDVDEIEQLLRDVAAGAEPSATRGRVN